MAEAVQMPKLGFDMAEGTLISWVKQVGETINKGDVIAEIETDKATIEIETSATGTILKLMAEPGDVLPVGDIIAYVGEAGEAVPDDGAAAAEPTAPEAAPTEAVPEAAAPAVEPVVKEAAPAAAVSSEFPGGVKASPVARRVAKDKGIDLTLVTGTGPGGRVIKKDVENYVPTTAASAGMMALAVEPTYGDLPTGPDVEIEEISKLRSRIAARMVPAKQQVPHFYVTSEMDVAELLALRKRLNDSLEDAGIKISVNDLIVKAAALTLRQYPNLNSHYYGDHIVRHKRINIGMAVALPNGGLINVIAKDADTTALGTMAAQNRKMFLRARDGKVRPDDVEDGTFTVSNLGPFDVDQFVAIINPPEAAILAVGTAKQVPVVQEDGTLGTGFRLKVTISVDHRVSDGAEAAEFLQAMKKLIENPMGMLV